MLIGVYFKEKCEKEQLVTNANFSKIDLHDETSFHFLSQDLWISSRWFTYRLEFNSSCLEIDEQRICTMNDSLKVKVFYFYGIIYNILASHPLRIDILVKLQRIREFLRAFDSKILKSTFSELHYASLFDKHYTIKGSNIQIDGYFRPVDLKELSILLRDCEKFESPIVFAELSNHTADSEEFVELILHSLNKASILENIQLPIFNDLLCKFRELLINRLELPEISQEWLEDVIRKIIMFDNILSYNTFIFLL